MDIITIDGPASSGKGTVAKIIAQKLGWHYLESGAIYRAVALIAKRYNPDNIKKLTELIRTAKLRFENAQVILDGEDITSLLRDEEIGMLASKLSKIAIIRDAVLGFQRSFAKEPGLVTDGRDMG